VGRHALTITHGCVIQICGTNHTSAGRCMVGVSTAAHSVEAQPVLFKLYFLHPACRASSEGMAPEGELGLLYFVVPVAPGRCRLMSLPMATNSKMRCDPGYGSDEPPCLETLQGWSAWRQPCVLSVSTEFYCSKESGRDSSDGD
jgi:hypothetical protein